jgi:hypothetical protein
MGDASDIIDFSFEVRMKENAVVRNANIHGVWGKEERDGGMPIVANQVFYVLIRNSGNSSFEVSAALYLCKIR